MKAVILAPLIPYACCNGNPWQNKDVHERTGSIHLNTDDLQPSVKAALEKAAHYCAYRERCMEEVRKKLWELKVDPDTQEEIISMLISQDFLNEERYAKLYAHSKFVHNKWGRNKIRQQLESRNISPRNIDTGLNEIDEGEYYRVTKALISRKKESLRDKNHWVQKRKITDFMLQKGYEYNIVKEFL